MKTPVKMSYSELRNIQREFSKPKTTTEALILHAANLELRERSETKDGLLTYRDVEDIESSDDDVDGDEIQDRVEECIET